MSLLNLYFDVTAKELRRGITDGGTYSIHELHQEDKLTITLVALQRNSYSTPPLFQKVALAGWSIRVSVGISGTVYATQATWSISADGYEATGTLDLDTAEIDALADNTQVKFEIILTDPSGNPKHGIFLTSVRKSVFTAGTALPVPSATAMSVEQAIATFMTKGGINHLVFIDQDTGSEYMVYFKSGTMQTPKISS